LLLCVPTTASRKEAAPLAARKITMTVGYMVRAGVRRMANEAVDVMVK
jgi:hypothetical protein